MEIQNVKLLTASLEYHRTISGLNKSELADKIGIHPNTLRKKEKSPLDFTLKELIGLQKALNVDNINIIFNINQEGDING